MLEDLIKDDKILNEVTDYLFDLLERHSLFEVSGYLALKVLNETSCTLNSDLANQLESYRAMKKGNVAPDIVNKRDNYAPGFGPQNFPKSLSDLTSEYTLVVFGASWCPKCATEIAELAKIYPQLKKKGLELLFVSLDENKSNFQEFAKSFPFISICVYKKWEGKALKDYYVFGTPLMYLLDATGKLFFVQPQSNKLSLGLIFLLKNQIS